MRWELWQGDADGWDALLLGFADHSIPQRYGWGEHKRDSGWTPFRMAACESGRTLAMAQVLLRRFPFGVRLAWVPGGPIGNVATWGEPFRSAVRKAAGGELVYCRINPTRELMETESATLRANSWQRPLHPMLSGCSILLDLTPDDEEWLKSISSKHRYYVKKSARADLTWAIGNTEALRRDLATLTYELSKEKAMDLHERDVAALESLSRSMPGAMQIVIGYAGAEPVTGCLALIHGAKAHYATAATVGSGRKLSAAYCMFSRLRSSLRRQNVKELDFGGTNPGGESTQGVDHFKRGFGGREIRYLGEWDWATNSILRRAASYIIKFRVRAM